MRAVFGQISIPNPVDWIGGAAGDLVEAPFKWLADQLKDWFNDIAEAYQDQFGTQSLAKAGGLQSYLLGESLGLAQFLAAGIFMAAATLIFLIPALQRRTGKLVKVVVGMLLAPVALFWGLGAVQDLGVAFADGIQELYTPTGKSNDLLAIDPIADILQSIVAYASALIPAGLLYLLWLGVQFIMLVSYLILLPFFALSAWAEWAERITNWAFSIFIVGALLFGFWVNLCLELGQYAMDKSPVGGPLWIVAMLLVAIALVLASIWALHKVVDHVHGKVYGRVRSWSKSKVSGKVKTEPAKEEGRRKSHSASFARSVLPRRMRGGHADGNAASGRTSKTLSSKNIKTAGKTAVATMAGGPGAGAKVAGTAIAEDRVMNRKKKQRPAGTRPAYGHAPRAQGGTSPERSRATRGRSKDTPVFHQHGRPVGPSDTSKQRIGPNGLPELPRPSRPTGK